MGRTTSMPIGRRDGKRSESGMGSWRRFRQSPRRNFPDQGERRGRSRTLTGNCGELTGHQDIRLHLADHSGQRRRLILHPPRLV